jgi:hypothetical protein
MALKTQTVILRVRRHIEDASKRRLPRRKTSSELRLLPRYILCTACRNFVSFRGTSCVQLVGTSSPSEVHPVYSLSELRLLPRYILCVQLVGTSSPYEVHPVYSLSELRLHSEVHPVYSLSELRLLTRYILYPYRNSQSNWGTFCSTSS